MQQEAVEERCFTNEIIKQNVEVGKLASRLHGGQFEDQVENKANSTCAKINPENFKPPTSIVIAD